MKSVNEIKDFKDKYRYMAINAQNTQNLNQFVFDVLIGITEHLEAQPVRSDDAIRREAMLKALRWIREITVGGAAYVSLVDWIDEAITRLENGGDL